MRIFWNDIQSNSKKKLKHLYLIAQQEAMVNIWKPSANIQQALFLVSYKYILAYSVYKGTQAPHGLEFCSVYSVIYGTVGL